MNDGKYYQTKYWNDIVEIKRSLYYINCYQIRYEKINRNIKIFLAITSSCSIASWAIWNHLILVWSIIIASTQVINAILHLLPFEKLLTKIYGLNSEYEKIFLIADRDWYYVSQGILTEEEINTKISTIRELKLNADSKYFSDTALPMNEGFNKIADSLTITYFNKY